MNQSKIDILQRALEREKAARKQAERILEKKSEELYRLSQELSESNRKLQKSILQKTSQLKGVFENIVDAYVVMDLDGYVITLNDAALDLLKIEKLDENEHLYSFIHPDDTLTLDTSFESLLIDGQIKGVQIRIVTSENEIRIVQVNSSLIFDENEKPIAIQGIVRDITKEKNDKDLLEASEQRFSSLFMNLDMGVLLEDEYQKIALVNSKFCALFEIAYVPEKIIGMDSVSFFKHHKDKFDKADEFFSNMKGILADKTMVLGDTLRLNQPKILKRDYIPIIEDAIYKGNLWVFQDVTLEAQYKQRIELEKNKYSNIIANMNLGLLEVDNNNKVLMANQSFIDMSGYTENELLGKDPKTIFLDNNSQLLLSSEEQKRIEGISNSYELHVKNKNGDSKHWLISGAPNYDLDGKTTGSIGIHLDITDSKNLERQKEELLTRLEKSNHELEEYAHIVSHDLKSPLRSINALISWIKEDNKGMFQEESLEHLSLIDVTLEKMEKLISDILLYSSIRSETIEKKQVDLNEVVSGLTQILFVPEHINIILLKKLPILRGDAVHLQQLFQNLLSNAIRYCDKKEGLVEIDFIEKTSYFQFSVKDNGIGIEPKNYEKIFKIFQSLHVSNESTGVGLSIVKKIVSMYGGEIWVKSELGKGSEFLFTLKKEKLWKNQI